jgi:2-polyprenyl-6-methoxyphenol hydroxylase-like FAD-dependent oxidoreductase
MAKIVMVGGGIVGTCAAVMLARDGHQVTVLERDGAGPPSPAAAWDGWERRGVNQFRLLHYFLPRFRQEIEAELPELPAAFLAAGALRQNPLDGIPEAISGGPRPGDERHAVLTGRRPVMESVVAALAADTPGLTVQRGTAVAGLLPAERAGAPLHIAGVVTDDGVEHRADLVIDAGGRRSPVAAWLAAIAPPGPREDLEDSGFLYFGRHDRSPDGSIPPAIGGNLQAYGSISVLTLPADNGTWGIGIVASAKDAALRRLNDPVRWERVVGACPLVAHWMQGEPEPDIAMMAKIEDRRRHYAIDGQPVATGVVPLADAWACTNPSLGRGISIGMMHAALLRRTVAEVPVADAVAFARRYHEATDAEIAPYFEDTLAFDRHRLAEVDAHIAGTPYQPDDPGWALGQALASAAVKDPDLLRAYLDVVGVLARGVDVLGRPGIAERAIALASDEQPPGPDRAELLRLVA